MKERESNFMDQIVLYPTEWYHFFSSRNKKSKANRACSLERFITRTNLFEKKILIFPTLIGDHWTLLILINPLGTIASQSITTLFCLDSLGESHPKLEHLVKEYLSGAWSGLQAHDKVSLLKDDSMQWHLVSDRLLKFNVVRPNLATQKKDSNDSGPYLLYFFHRFMERIDEYVTLLYIDDLQYWFDDEAKDSRENWKNHIVELAKTKRMYVGGQKRKRDSDKE